MYMKKDKSDQSVCEVAENFSPPRVCRRARITGLRGGWSLDDSAMCPVTGRTWDLSNPQKQKLLAASLPLLVLAKVEMAVIMYLAQAPSRSQVCVRHPASASPWNLSSLRRLIDISGIYSFDSDLLKIYTRSWTTDELIDKGFFI